MRTVRSRFRTLLVTTAIAVGVGGLVLLEAPGAWAGDVTNPAQHPYPVTVTINGQTYHDGLDTLPGYDDYACTPIPDVQYDFADNEVLYYDDSGNLLATAPWTEWSRISSYKEWKAQQAGAGSSSGPTKAPTKAPTTTKSAGHTSTTGGSTSGHTSATGTTSGQVTSPSAAGASPSASTTDKPTAKSTKGAHAIPASLRSGSTSGAPTDVAATLASEKLDSKVSSGLGLGSGNTRDIGLSVLAGLAAISLSVLVGGALRGRGSRHRRPDGETS
ncbi:MAG: hypothetical protein ACTHJM_14815 [Marmoricola sp.]